MLQHSRSSSNHIESTNINPLIDEYVRLAFHGMRAKDKSFNTAIKTDFNECVGNVNIVPKEIGRVILNLLNNAFYAVSEKRKHLGDKFEPVVSVNTKRVNDKVLVSIKDNGVGIAPQMVDKIFQPFFTTKPAGQVPG